MASPETEKKEENTSNPLTINNQSKDANKSIFFLKNQGNTIIELPKKNFLSQSLDQNSATLNPKKMESFTSMKNNKMKLEPSLIF